MDIPSWITVSHGWTVFGVPTRASPTHSSSAAVASSATWVSLANAVGSVCWGRPAIRIERAGTASPIGSVLFLRAALARRCFARRTRSRGHRREPLEDGAEQMSDGGSTSHGYRTPECDAQSSSCERGTPKSSSYTPEEDQERQRHSHDGQRQEPGR